jgi:hypothetical protein
MRRSNWRFSAEATHARGKLNEALDLALHLGRRSKRTDAAGRLFLSQSILPSNHRAEGDQEGGLMNHHSRAASNKSRHGRFGVALPSPRWLPAAGSDPGA